MEHIKSQSQGLVTSDRDHGHEESDINVKAIFGFAIFLFLGAVAAHVLLWGMYVYLDKRAEKRDEGVMSPVQTQMQAPQPTEKKSAQGGQVGTRNAETSKEALQRLQAQFPSPRLQDDNVRDLRMMRANEDKILQGYTWVDKSSGAVRIPVERAMQVLSERGLPNVAGETPQNKAAAKAPASPAPQ
jgi:hypothetical protein